MPAPDREAQVETAARERVTYDSFGCLDEVVLTGGAHLERMGDRSWFLVMTRADGTEVCVWLSGRVTDMEERPARIDR